MKVFLRKMFKASVYVIIFYILQALFFGAIYYNFSTFSHIFFTFSSIVLLIKLIIRLNPLRKVSLGFLY